MHDEKKQAKRLPVDEKTAQKNLNSGCAKPYVEPHLTCHGEVARLTLNVFSF